MIDYTYKLASSEIVFDSFEGEAVVLDLNTGRYFSFSDRATAIWTAVTSGGSFSQIIDCGVDTKTFTQFIEKAISFDLIVVSEGNASDLSPEIAKGLASTTGKVEIEVYDDIADLIMSDPIHEVDKEAGWPKKPTQL